ncbi:sugar phosphate nucleotidyltransferase, partial [Vibrio parahaemolyticus]
VDGFVKSFRRAAEATSQHSRLALIGVEPTYPATGFNYIERNGAVDGADEIYDVVRFTEKPDSKQAKKFIASGKYLWNS